MELLQRIFGFSLKVARIARIDVRVHITLLLYALYLVLHPWPETAVELGLRLGFVGLLFGSVLLHEFGHSFAGRFCDGESETILLWPLGGLAFVSLPASPIAHFLTALAGPLVSLALWGGATALRPLVTGWHLQLFLYELARMNLAIVLFNLIPAFPMDGGRMLQAALWRGVGYMRSMWICCNLALVIGVLMFLVSFVNVGSDRVNVMLSAVACFVFFSAWQERQGLLYGEASAEYWSSRPGVAYNHPYRTEEAPRPGMWRRFIGWLTGRFRRPTGTSDFLTREEFIRKEVDPILDKISREGMQSLTRRERKILESAKDLLQKQQR
jgi:Zn-dependent protease